MFLTRLCPNNDKLSTKLQFQYQKETEIIITNFLKNIAISNSTVLVHSPMLGVENLYVVFFSDSPKLAFFTMNFFNYCDLHV